MKGKPHLAVFATKNIKDGEQILYDYGVPSLPWRKMAKESKVKRKSRTAVFGEQLDCFSKTSARSKSHPPSSSANMETVTDSRNHG